MTCPWETPPRCEQQQGGGYLFRKNPQAAWGGGPRRQQDLITLLLVPEERFGISFGERVCSTVPGRPFSFPVSLGAQPRGPSQSQKVPRTLRREVLVGVVP